MCGRFTLHNSNKVIDKIGFDIAPNYNIVPSNLILILIPEPVLLYWGLTPEWATKPMNLINARIETLKEKPAFKNSKPCIIVSDGWFEWKKSNTVEKIPYYIHNNNNFLDLQVPEMKLKFYDQEQIFYQVHHNIILNHILTQY